jgi:hypothetical protein
MLRRKKLDFNCSATLLGFIADIARETWTRMSLNVTVSTNFATYRINRHVLSLVHAALTETRQLLVHLTGTHRWSACSAAVTRSFAGQSA